MHKTQPQTPKVKVIILTQTWYLSFIPYLHMCYQNIQVLLPVARSCVMQNTWSFKPNISTISSIVLYLSHAPWICETVLVYDCYHAYHHLVCTRVIGRKDFSPVYDKTLLKGMSRESAVWVTTRWFANNKGADQPAHMRSLISDIVIRLIYWTVSYLDLFNAQFNVPAGLYS